LNQDILKFTIKATGQIPKLLQIEITHYDETNDKIFDIDIDININIDMKAVWFEQQMLNCHASRSENAAPWSASASGLRSDRKP
jgi:hypothetical protein